MQHHDNLELNETPRIIDAEILTPTKPTKKRIGTLLVFSIGILLLVVTVTFAGLSFAAQDTLPGDPLYSFKTKISEEAIAATKFTSVGRAEYAVTRLEKRLRELQLLSVDNASSTDDVLNHIAYLSEKHTTVATSNLQDNQSVTFEGRINTLAALASIARAQEIITDETPEFAEIAKPVSTLEGTANDALRSTIDTFASTTDQMILATFLETQIGTVSELLPEVANGSRAQTLAMRRISDTNEAIADGQLGEGIYYILKAKEAITVDGYLYAAERGYVDGITQEAGPIPEGS